MCLPSELHFHHLQLSPHHQQQQQQPQQQQQHHQSIRYTGPRAFIFCRCEPLQRSKSPNPFQAQQAPKPSMNQLRTTGIGGPGLAAAPPSNAGAPGSAPGPWGSPQPSVGFGMAPSATASQDENPFLL
nr:splicing factor, proline- and glutamine-rich-like [Penaeus vannamei]